MLEWYKRLRHSRGFGIHSPSAYRMICEILRPSKLYGYYAYADLERFANMENTHSELCLIYRIMVDLHPGTVISIGSKSVTETIKKALPACYVSERIQNSCDLAVVGLKGVDLSVNCEWQSIFLYNEGIGLADVFISKMTAGHVFLSHKHCLILNRADLPFQIFSLNY